MLWKKLADQAGSGKVAVVRAAQIWSFLIGKAYARQTLRYKELRELLGYTDDRPLNPILRYLMDYCESKKLPPLTILVVNSHGKPGNGFTVTQDFHKELEKVFNHKWFNHLPPTLVSLAEAKK